MSAKIIKLTRQNQTVKTGTCPNVASQLSRLIRLCSRRCAQLDLEMVK